MLANCSNVLLENINHLGLTDSYDFAVTMSNANNIVATGCSFHSGGTGHDGLHFDGLVEDILIDNCYFATGDDAIALNAYEGYGGDISNVTITNCIFNGSLTVFRAYGSASGDDTHKYQVSNVTGSNCVGFVHSCIASLRLSAGGCNNSNTDEANNITVSNCDIIHGGSYAPFLICCNARALSINNHTHHPQGTISVVQSFGTSVTDVTVNGLAVVRGPEGNAACGIVEVPTGTLSKLTLRGIKVIDQVGSSYSALPFVVSAGSALTELVIDSIDMDKFTALLDSSSGTAHIGSIKGVALSIGRAPVHPSQTQ